MPPSASSSSSILSLCLLLVHTITAAAKATRYPPGVKPPQLEFDLMNIKTPQLVGIVFGVLVFSLTIMSVIMLLYKSGTLSRFQSEIQSGAPLKVNLGDKTSVTPQNSSQPELYDHLIEATQQLPINPHVPLLKGKLIELREYNESSDLEHLLQASNGEACFHESAYDPIRIWGWLPNFIDPFPSRDGATLAKCLKNSSAAHCTHLVIVDPTLQKAVGMLSLVDNSTTNLTIRIGMKFPHVLFLFMLVVRNLVLTCYFFVSREFVVNSCLPRHQV
jgi:hypothetical protein